MELPNRTSHERAYIKRLSRLNQRHKRELRQLLGSPPDPSRVPMSFWEKVEREQMEENLLMMYLIFIASASFHAFGTESPAGRDADELQSAAETYAAGRAAAVARSYAETGRDRLETLQRDIDGRVTPIAIGQLEVALDKILGPARAEAVGTSETTAAQTAGGEAGIEATVGIDQADLWINHPELSRTGPCPICEPLHMLPRSVWESSFPEGPGPSVHPGCVCTIRYANEQRGQRVA